MVWAERILEQQDDCDSLADLHFMYNGVTMRVPAICTQCRTVCWRGRCVFRYCWKCGAPDGVRLYDEVTPRHLLADQDPWEPL
jgi:hypothetical protein